MQLTPSLALEFSEGLGGGTSPAKNAIGVWHPLQSSATGENFGSTLPCSTAKSKYSI